MILIGYDYPQHLVWMGASRLSPTSWQLRQPHHSSKRNAHIYPAIPSYPTAGIIGSVQTYFFASFASIASVLHQFHRLQSDSAE
jgi:hypothetical protein